MVKQQYANTYFVQTSTNVDELARLAIQDEMVTHGMGGVLPELLDHSRLERILDVGCGTGGWLIEVAKTYSTIKTGIGVDINTSMVECARQQATAQKLADRVQFRTMDALIMLEFPNGFFDLVNQRFATSWLRTWEWAKILAEYQRVTRPGGIIRLTETHHFESNSPAQMKIAQLILETSQRSGRLFTASHDGVTRELPHLLTQYGIENIQSQTHTLTYQAGTEAAQAFYEDLAILYRVAQPFFQKWTRLPPDYEKTCQQALQEMRQPDFVATWTLMTFWGTRSHEPLIHLHEHR